MYHIYMKHEDCDNAYCPICQGGLSVCIRCGLIEGSLTTHCPGEHSYEDHSDNVYTGQEDFIHGEWVKQTSPHSPAYWTKERIEALD